MFEYAWDVVRLSEECSASVAQKDAYASLYSFVKAKKGQHFRVCAVLLFV